MRTLRKNAQKLMYALQIAEVPEFEFYEDEDGNKYPVGIIPNGKTEVVYGETVSFLGNIADSGGEAEATMYGLSVSDYSCVMVLTKNTIPVTEGMLIWVDSEPQFKHIEVDMEVDGKSITLNGDYPIKESADFYVVKKPLAKNFERIPLQAINK